MAGEDFQEMAVHSFHNIIPPLTLVRKYKYRTPFGNNESAVLWVPFVCSEGTGLMI